MLLEPRMRGMWEVRRDICCRAMSAQGVSEDVFKFLARIRTIILAMRFFLCRQLHGKLRAQGSSCRSRGCKPYRVVFSNHQSDLCGARCRPAVRTDQTETLIWGGSELREFQKDLQLSTTMLWFPVSMVPLGWLADARYLVGSGQCRTSQTSNMGSAADHDHGCSQNRTQRAAPTFREGRNVHISGSHHGAA